MNANSKEMPVASKPKWQILDATTLKFLAVVLMVLDHIHEMFVSMGAPMWLTMAGRLVLYISEAQNDSNWRAACSVANRISVRK